MAGRRIVVGDIHGCYDELMELLEKVDIGDDDRIFLGGLGNRRHCQNYERNGRKQRSDVYLGADVRRAVHCG